MDTRGHRRGFVLPTVLLSITVLSLAAFAVAASARTSSTAAANRVSKMRATWAARACLALARAAAQQLFERAADGAERDLLWRSFGREMREGLGSLPDCDVAIEPSGVRANVNTLDSLGLRRLLSAAGGNTGADQRVAALLDWRDPDDVPRAGGAERAWYRQQQRLEPRNAPVRSWPELAQVRGLDGVERLRELAGFEEEMVSLTHSPPEVLAAVAGEDPVVRDHLLRERHNAGEARTLTDLFWSPDTLVASRLLAALPDLTRRLTLTPEFWRAVAVRQSDNGIIVRIEQHWVRTRDEVLLSAERLR